LRLAAGTAGLRIAAAFLHAFRAGFNTGSSWFAAGSCRRAHSYFLRSWFWFSTPFTSITLYWTAQWDASSLLHGSPWFSLCIPPFACAVTLDVPDSPRCTAPPVTLPHRTTTPPPLPRPPPFLFYVRTCQLPAVFTHTVRGHGCAVYTTPTSHRLHTRCVHTAFPFATPLCLRLFPSGFHFGYVAPWLHFTVHVIADATYRFLIRLTGLYWVLAARTRSCLLPAFAAPPFLHTPPHRFAAHACCRTAPYFLHLDSPDAHTFMRLPHVYRCIFAPDTGYRFPSPVWLHAPPPHRTVHAYWVLRGARYTLHTTSAGFYLSPFLFCALHHVLRFTRASATSPAVRSSRMQALCIHCCLCVHVLPWTHAGRLRGTTGTFSCTGTCVFLPPRPALPFTTTFAYRL